MPGKSLISSSRLGETRRVSADPLNLSPTIVGAVLASPARRALAMLVDLSLIGLLSEVGGIWLVAGLGAVALLLRGPLAGRRKRVVVGWLFVALLALLAAVDAWDEHRGPRHPPAVEADDGGEAATAAAAAAKAAAASAPEVALARRVAELEAELAEARKPRALKWRDELKRLFDAVGIGFGWGIVYFSLLPAWWNGQTLGKKLLGLRTVELTGRPLTVMRCLRRYGGYAAGMATGGLGFLACLWDPNRQAIQDRVAHTVVVDLRGPPSSPGAAGR